MPVAALTLGIPFLIRPGERVRSCLVWLASLFAAGGYWYVRNLIHVGSPIRRCASGSGHFISRTFRRSYRRSRSSIISGTPACGATTFTRPAARVRPGMVGDVGARRRRLRRRVPDQSRADGLDRDVRRSGNRRQLSLRRTGLLHRGVVGNGPLHGARDRARADRFRGRARSSLEARAAPHTCALRHHRHRDTVRYPSLEGVVANRRDHGVLRRAGRHRGRRHRGCGRLVVPEPGASRRLHSLPRSPRSLSFL